MPPAFLEVALIKCGYLKIQMTRWRVLSSTSLCLCKGQGKVITSKVLWWPLGEYMCHKLLRICCTYRKYFPILFLFMTYHRVCNQSNTTGATSGAGTAYLPEHLRSPPVLSGFVLLDLQFYVYLFLQIVVCLFVLIFWPLYCLFLLQLRLLITHLISSNFLL